MKRKTNVDFVVDLMEYAPQGALIQAFVMEALHHYSDQVLQIDVNDFPQNGIVNPEAWIGCAKFVNNKMKERFNHE